MSKYTHPLRNLIIFLIVLLVVAVVFFPVSQDGGLLNFTKSTEKDKFKKLFRVVHAQEAHTMKRQNGCEEYIAFTSKRDGNYEIYTMKPDGSELIRLTYSLADDPLLADNYNPSISPDGQKIAFTSRRDNNYEIYVMNYDGSNQTRLTYAEGGNDFSAWSPDGERIAFTSWRDGNSEIYVMSADGSNQINLTNNPADDVRPNWSPDGNTIIFESSRDYNGPNPYEPTTQLYTVTTDGLVEKIVDAPDVRWPSWSPDGLKIAFIAYQNMSSELHIREFGADVDTVLDTQMMIDGKVIWPILPPNGKYIIFDSNITIMSSQIDGKVIWSPDGKDILFGSNTNIMRSKTETLADGFISRTTWSDNIGEIYRIGADGSNLIQLTSIGDFNGSADWQSRCVQ